HFRNHQVLRGKGNMGRLPKNLPLSGDLCHSTSGNCYFGIFAEALTIASRIREHSETLSVGPEQMVGYSDPNARNCHSFCWKNSRLRGEVFVEEPFALLLALLGQQNRFLLAPRIGDEFF